jgi:hypothetical protein
VYGADFFGTLSLSLLTFSTHTVLLASILLSARLMYDNQIKYFAWNIGDLFPARPYWYALENDVNGK